MIKYSIWLQSILGTGNNRVNEIFSAFKSAQNVYNSSGKKLVESGLFTKKQISKLKFSSLKTAENIIELCRESNIHIVAYGMPQYPKCLYNIEDPPIVLYYKGELPDFDETPTICIVGPRKVSEFGKKASYSLSRRLSKAGFIIVSGGAEGSDKYAHMGALDVGGLTVLFMGCGINLNYPQSNEKLRKLVGAAGCIISEYPPDTPAFASNFPVRNRLMSAVSHGTVVIEAGSKSGSLITARLANEQGKDVFVIPGSPVDPVYAGSNELLRDGAKPLIDASDIFNEYIVRFADKINIERAFEKDNIKSKEKNKKILDDTLSKEAKILYNNLDKQEFYPEYFHNTGLSNEDIISALVELEISGVIKSAPGGKYVLK